MTAFVFTELTPAQCIQSTALGTGSGNTFASPYDIGKPVTLAAANNHVLAAANAEIAGFVNTIEPFTVNNGYSFGGILVEGRIEALVGPNQGATPMAVGDYVVADTQLALGTGTPVPQWTPPGTAPSTPTGPTARVKTGTPSKKLWQCIRIISGTGVAGDRILLERQ